MWSVLRGVDYLIAGDITKAAASLGVDAQDLTKTLKKRSFKAGTDSFETARSGDELRAAQYGLVRSLYSWVFDVSLRFGHADYSGSWQESMRPSTHQTIEGPPSLLLIS